MNRYLQEGDLVERYLNNIEQQNQILMNLLETINRQIKDIEKYSNNISQLSQQYKMAI